MMMFVAGVIAGWVSMILLVVVAAATAPEGYEDEAGFHLGRDPRVEDLARQLAAYRLGLTDEEIRFIESRREGQSIR